MGRPRKIVSDLSFTTGEVANACGLTARQVIHLCNVGILKSEGAGSLAASREIGILELFYAAIIGELVSMGFEGVMAGNAVKAMPEHYHRMIRGMSVSSARERGLSIVLRSQYAAVTVDVSGAAYDALDRIIASRK
jgi:hypothetical protein